MIVLWRIGVRSSCRSGSKALGPEATVGTSTSREEKTERTFPRLSHGVHALAAPSQRLMLAISGPRNSITSLCLLDLDSCDRCEVFSSIAAPSMAAEVGGWARSCSRRATSAVLQRRGAECRCRWMSRVERRESDGRVSLSGFGNIAPWWRVPFRVVARRRPRAQVEIMTCARQSDHRSSKKCQRHGFVTRPGGSTRLSNEFRRGPW